MMCNEVEANSTVLVCAGDFHVGGKNTDLDALKKMVNDVRKNDYHLLVMGDLCECITSRDKRFSMGTVDPQFLGEDMIGKQYKYLDKLLKPIAGQIIGIHEGNHDESITKYSEINMVSQLCENLGVKYLGYNALTRLTYMRSGRKNSYTLYSTHGYFGGRTRGPKVNALEGLCASIDACAYYAGHSHDLFATSIQQIYLSKYGHLSTRTIYTGNTGSFLRGIVENNSSYAESKGYKPLKIGYLKTTFDPCTYGMKMEEVIM